MSAPSACPVLVWGRSWSPPKPKFWGICGTSLLQAGRGRQGGSLGCCVCYGHCVSEPEEGTTSIFVWFISHFLLLFQELAPLQKQSTVWVELGLPAEVTQNLIYLPNIHVRAVSEEMCTCNPPFFLLLFPFPTQMLLFIPGPCPDADEGCWGMDAVLFPPHCP